MIKRECIQLENGLRIVIVNDNTKHIQYGELKVLFGGRTKKVKVNDEIITIPDGIAHLLEHTVYENTIYGNLNTYFKENYIDSNAFTAYDSTGYYIETVFDFKEHLQELIKAVNTPVFTDENLEHIKLPIYEEIKGVKDQKYKIYNDARTHNILVDNDYIDNVGNIEDIKGITKEYLMKIYKIFYQPCNQVITISGNYDIKEIVKMIEDTYNELNIERVEYEILDKDSNTDFREKVVEVVDPKYNDIYCMTFKIDTSKYTFEDIRKMRYYVNYYISNIFSDDREAFKEAFEKGYTKYSFNRTSSFNYIDNCLLIDIELETSNIKEVKKIILDTLNKKEIDRNEFKLKHKSVVIDSILRSDNIYKVVSEYSYNIIKYNFDGIDTVEFVDSLNVDECIKYINELDFSNYAEIIDRKE